MKELQAGFNRHIFKNIKKGNVKAVKSTLCDLVEETLQEPRSGTLQILPETVDMLVSGYSQNPDIVKTFASISFKDYSTVIHSVNVMALMLGFCFYSKKSLTETKRLATSRNPWSLSLSPDGSRIFVTNNLSRFVEFRTPSMSEITVVGTGEGGIRDRWVVPESNLLMGVAWHPSGEFALATLNRTKNLVPMTRILQGWTITNGIGILWRDGRVDEDPLDGRDNDGRRLAAELGRTHPRLLDA